MKKDESWKKFFDDNERYADIINGVGCGGVQFVKPENLQELDTASKKKARDLIRKVAFGVNFAIIGIENQDELDYKLPFRALYYEVAQYQKQVSAISRMIRGWNKEKRSMNEKSVKEQEKLRPGEFLYGFRKKDRLKPVITFVLYTGKEPWDGPLCLHDMLDFSEIPESLKALTADYSMKLIDIRRMEDTSVFKTDVRYVFDFIRYAENKQMLYQLVMNEPYYQSMDEETYEVVCNYTNLEGLIKEDKGEGGNKDMCKAIRDLMEDSREEGREEGESLLSKLIQLLLSEKRFDDIDRVTRDKEYRAKLFKEFQIL